MAETRVRLLKIMLDAGVEPNVVESVKPGVPLIAQGVDSIDHAAILLHIQDTLGIVVGDEEALTLATLEDFETLLHRA